MTASPRIRGRYRNQAFVRRSARWVAEVAALDNCAASDRLEAKSCCSAQPQMVEQLDAISRSGAKCDVYATC